MREKISAEEAVEKLYKCLNEIEWLCSDYRRATLNFNEDPCYYIIPDEPNRTKDQFLKWRESIETFGISKYQGENINDFLKDFEDSLNHIKNKFSIYEARNN